MNIYLDTEEKVCDYNVTVKIKKTWRIQLKLLQKLEEVCKKHNIKYFAVCGTLLGAVRHNGFIPWDDDMDVGLLREDYNKLIYALKYEFEYPFFLQTPISESERHSNVTRLRYSESTAIELRDKNLHCNNGIYIDVFPFDGVVDNKIKRKFHFFEIGIYSYLLSHTRVFENQAKKPFSYYICSPITKAVGYDNLFIKYQKVCAKYSNKASERMGILSGSRQHTEFYYPRKALQDIKYIDFEDVKIPVPVDFDACLKVNYGDYMKLPPIEKRGMWHADELVIDPDIPYYEYQKNEGWI